MHLRRCLAVLLALLLSLSPVGSARSSTLALGQGEPLASLAPATEQTVELCLTLDTPSVAQYLEQGESEPDAWQRVADAQQAVCQSLLAIQGSEVLAQNGYLVNALTVRIPSDEADALSTLPGVERVTYSQRYSLPALAEPQDAQALLDSAASDPTAGEGQIIAVIDTGLDLTHMTMRLDDPSSAKLTEQEANVLVKALGYGAYYNAKIPFYYNYADGDTDVLDENNGQHGMHVAGICAGNSPTMKGVAPQAQILAMRVFGKDSDTAADYAVVAAIEDAVRLGADVINLSLGSAYGFSSLGSDPYQQALAAAEEQGVIIVAAAGNDGRSDVSTSRENGTYVLADEALEDNATLSAPASYDGFFSVAACKTDAELAYFSSFGPAPDLSFAPHITAPGYNIRSSVNHNEYAKKSGTSMATPAVSGAFAALKASLEERGLLPEGAEGAERIRALLMNTALPMSDAGAPLSVRGQGAGLLQLDSALDARVTVVADDGQGAVELGQIDTTEERTISILLHLSNFGTETAVYRIPAQTVYTEETATQSTVCIPLDGAEMGIPAEDTVTLAAGERITLSFTLRLAAGTSGYVEGYLYLSGENAPDLSVPYLGYAGEWDDPMVLLSEDYTPMLATIDPDAEEPTLMETTILSPNGDGYCDYITPLYYQLRNAARTDYEIYDAAGSRVCDVAHMLGTTKDHYADLHRKSLLDKLDPQEDTIWFFDGRIWNPLTDRYEVMADGDYTMRITLYPESYGQAQTIDIPFTVDTSSSIQERTIERSATDSLSVSSLEPSGSFDLEWATSLPRTIHANTPGLDVETRRLTLYALCASPPVELQYADGSAVTWSVEEDDPLLLTIELPVQEGYHAFAIHALNKKGEPIATLTGAYYADLTAPQVEPQVEIKTADWLPDYICGIVSPQAEGTELSVSFGDNSPYGMLCTVNDTVVMTDHQYRVDQDFVLSMEEGALLWITCEDANGNLTEQLYLVTDLDWTRGDVNRDGKINASDALLTLQHSVKLIDLTAVEQVAGDVTSNAALDAQDALRILQYSVGLVEVL